MFLPSTALSKIYKWVDESGTVHFSDKPYSDQAQEITVKGTGINVHQDPRLAEDKPIEIEKTAPSPASQGKTAPPKRISEKDYRISANVGELGGDAVQISGRVSSGPRCEKMTVKATAASDTGLRATITDHISKSTSHGSAIFSGTAKATGSADDYGFWKIESVVITCDDDNG